MSNPRYVCPDCQTEVNDNGERERVDKVRECSTVGNAEVLAEIHASKTGHNPVVRE